MSYKVGMVSLGCSKNQVDGEMLLATVQQAGYTLCNSEEEADAVIVNTCGFIESAKKESIDEILQLARRKEAGKLKAIVVTGCLAERYQTEIRKELPEVDAVLGIGANKDIALALKEALEGHKKELFASKYDLSLSGERVLSTPKFYAYLKISDGCDNCCTYCAIPLIRGRFRSRTMEDIVAEAEQLVANGVKELVLAGLFLTSRDVVGGIEWCREHAGEEDISKKMEKSKKAFAGNEIRGKKLGVIGLGAIGCEVANAAAALGMEVYGYDPFISVNAAWMLSRSVKHIMDVNTIYKDCDYITVHVPLLDSTKEMINQAAFDQMKDGVVILNYARDLLVNDDDMAEALKSGKVKKYITDFPNAKTSAMEGVIATPHLGASTEESEDNCAVMATDELKDYLENGNIKNSVNYPACDMGICQVAGRIGLLHANVPNMIGQITSILAAEGINIANMTNKSRDKYAYTLLDLEDPAKAEAVSHLEKINGMYKVRVIKG